jgi:CorA-like Mg2+ transporter protein
MSSTLDQVMLQSDQHSRSPTIAHFRQVLVWPVYLIPLQHEAPLLHRWEQLSDPAPDNPWRVVEDEFTGDPTQFHERHYSEFVTFLPPVQRFLYGEGISKSQRRKAWESPIKVMRRCDIARMRVELAQGAAPIELKIAHVDLYFFFDIDVAVLALEVFADDVPLAVAQEIMFKLGRAYPAYWEDGHAGHCPWRVEWLSASGEVLAASDYQERSKFLTFACEHRAPRVAAHWEYLLQPLVPHHSDKKGAMRYRQLEYYRMPFMAYLAVDRPEELTRADRVRLALGTEPGASDELPFSEQYLARFEHDHCYDRHHGIRVDRSWAGARFMSSGHALVVTGPAENKFFTDEQRGALGMFRHQHFLLFLIAHFHKAALLMFSDRLAGAVGRLEVGNPQAMLAFRKEMRQAHEVFLRFTHRYWFHEVSNNEQARDLFDLCRRHLGLDRLHQDIRQEVGDMSEYLENEAMRRQHEGMMRLTVVTTFGLAGTVATGFLGMNLFSHSDHPTEAKLLYFVIVFVPVVLLTLYTVRKSRRLSEFLDALADDALGIRAKWHAFWRIWRRKGTD